KFFLNPLLSSSDRETNGLLFPAKIDIGKIDIRYQIGPGASRTLLQFSRDRTHSADWNFPLTRFVSDQVIEKATVLQQGRIVRVCEGSHLRVGQHQSAHKIVLEMTLDRAPERFFRQTSPRLRGDTLRHFRFRDERFQ